MKRLSVYSIAGLLCLLFAVTASTGQIPFDRQMQQLNYTMDIRFHANSNKFTGYQKLIYRNESPDTLKQLFYHLFYNAFQHGSQMENRAMFIRDQEGLSQKIQALGAAEEGYERIDSLKVDGVIQKVFMQGTILQVELADYFIPHATKTIECWFNSQVPKMLVRTGRNNQEQINFTMTQWYPKLAMYDRAGWHADEYIRREFYGPFAGFDVTIEIDSAYTVAATGLLQNAAECGHGYTDLPGTSKTPLLTWHFIADRVHDFAWAADTSYIHSKKIIRTGLETHFFYKKETATLSDWQSMPQDVQHIFNWMETKVGPYPYPVYSLIQGGSGGTEYPMLSMILGKRPVSKGLSKGYPVITLAIHEIMHNWWYAAVANDETRNAWLDEGFALFFQDEYMDVLDPNAGKAIQTSYDYLRAPMRIQALEPMSTPSDYFDANWSYDASVYHKGAVFLNQLRYIVGENAFWKGIRNYYSVWTFGHPDGDDFIACMEKSSGMQLKWYLDLWTKTNNCIDYRVGLVEKNGQETNIHLLNKNKMPMPIDLRIILTDGTAINYNIPLVSMYGHKSVEEVNFLPPWGWTNPEYITSIPVSYDKIDKIEIDPEKKLLDLYPENNSVRLQIKNNKK